MHCSANAVSSNTAFKGKSHYAQGALSSVCAKTRLCKFFSNGGCPRGSACRFAHGQEELQAAPDLSHTKMCPALVKFGVCKRGRCCRFAHSDEQLRPIVEVVPKPALAAALLAAWQEKSDRWNDVSTDASDGVASETCSLGRDTHALSDDLSEALSGQFRAASRGPALEVHAVEESFLEPTVQLTEGSRLFHTPTGTPLAIRNTFFDIDDSSARAGATRRSSSAGPRVGFYQPLL